MYENRPPAGTATAEAQERVGFVCACLSRESPASDVQSQSQAESQEQSQSQTESHAQSKSQPESHAQSQSQSQSQAESQPQAQEQAQPESQSQLQSQEASPTFQFSNEADGSQSGVPLPQAQGRRRHSRKGEDKCIVAVYYQGKTGKGRWERTYCRFSL